MSEQEKENEPGIEFDYSMVDGQMHTAVVIRDADKIRKIVDANFRFLPAVMGHGKYPGMEAMMASKDENEIAVLMLSHVPSNMPYEEALEHIDHQLYLVEPEDLMTMIATGLNMFIRDGDQTQVLMHMILHLLGLCGEHEGDSEDG